MARDVEGRVRRLDDWADARYSIVSAEAWRDPTLTETELRVLLALGSVNTERGWCEASQTGIAKKLGCSRQTVSEAANALVRRRYVDVMRQTKTRALCYYRVLIDDPLVDAESENRARDDAVAGVSSGDDTGVSSGTTPPIYSARARDRSEIRDHSPLKPPSGGTSAKPEDGSWKTRALEALRASGENRDVVDALIAPLLASDKRLSLGRDVAAAAEVLSGIAATSRGIPSEALAAAAQRLIGQPSKLTAHLIRDHVELARNAGAMVMVRRGTPQHQRWVEHYRTTDPAKARFAEAQDLQMPSEWPPAARPGRAA